MGETMCFPETWEEFIRDYEFKDSKEVYTNGSMLIPSFRVKQMVKHYCSDECKKVVRAEWVKQEELKGYDKCSNCGCLAWIDTDFDQSLPSPYCPNCGATMKGFENG